jgi:hypothetical protein
MAAIRRPAMAVVKGKSPRSTTRRIVGASDDALAAHRCLEKFQELTGN